MESFDIAKFSKRLKELREERKRTNAQFTQGYVANLIGVARTTYTSYESGAKQPPLENVFSLAKLFNCTTDYLLGRSDDPTKTEQDYIKSIIGITKNGEEMIDLKEIFKLLKSKKIVSDGKVLEGEEKRRAIEVLKLMFPQKNEGAD
jgi:DNA-binding XRE family transcriptional regulator